MTEGTAATFTVTVTVTAAPTAATTVSVAVTEDTSGGQDFVASGNEITHMVSIPASGSPGAGSAMLSIPTVGDNTQEPDGAVTATVNTDSGYAVGNPSLSMVVVNDDDGATPAVSVTMSASDGDSDGNALEGASNTTGYRTITLALDQALTAGQTVTVPLTVIGATVTTDYTFALQPSTQTGV